MHEVELERTFLAKTIPHDLCDYPFVEVDDLYIPFESEHPSTRIRKLDEKYYITKKQPVGNSASEQTESTIILSKSEFEALSIVKGKGIKKLRYKYPYGELTAEFDVFLDELSGLVLVDFEFRNRAQMEEFEIPDFCLVDVTEEKFIAGGMLCGKKYADIKTELDQLHYKKLSI